MHRVAINHHGKMTSVQFTSLNTFRPYSSCRNSRPMYVSNTSIVVVSDDNETRLA